MKFCPRCGLHMLAFAQFCGNCGFAPEPAVAQAPAPSMMSMGEGGGGGAFGSPGIPPPPGISAQPPPAEGGASPGLIARVRNLLLSPKSEWPVIAPEATSAGQLFTGYVLPLAAVVAVLNFLRMSVIGIRLPFGGTIRSPLTAGLTNAGVTLVLAALGVVIVGFIINMLARTFGGQSDSRQALKTAAYSMTPAYVGSLFGLLPSFATLLQLVAGTYGIYLLYLGLPIVMRSDRNRAGGYTAAVVVCTIVAGIVIGVATTALGVRQMGGFRGAMTEAQRRQEGADTAASIIGGALGTDEKGKAGISTALSNLARAGEQMERQQRAVERQRDAAPAGSSGSAASDASVTAPAAASAGATADAAPGSADPARNAAAATAGLLTALGGALGGDKRVEPVDFHTLQGMLPSSIPGMTRAHAEGAAQEALGVKSSSATGTYRGTGEGSVEIKISDASGVSGLMDLASQFGGSQSSESDTGYEKDVTVGGRTVHEKYDRGSRHGELSVIVAKRYAVDVTGSAVDMTTLEKALGEIDLAGLESMKDSGAK